MKSSVISSFLLLWILLVAPTAATSVDCNTPPGLSGRITCDGDYIPLCKASGRRIEGRCIFRNPEVFSDANDAQDLLLKIISREGRLSADEIERYRAHMSSGKVRVGNSVFTFNLEAGESGFDGPHSQRTSSLWISILLAVVAFIGGIIAVKLGRFKTAGKNKVRRQT